MKTLLILLLLVISINCGPIEDVEPPTIQIIIVEKQATTPIVVNPPIKEINQKAMKYGQYFIDPINENLCERRDDITKNRPDLINKCLPVKLREFKIEKTCKFGSDKFFIDVASYKKDIKITEKDGKFYEAISVNQPISTLYTGEYIGPFAHKDCRGIPMEPSWIFIVYPNLEKEVFPNFPNLP